MPTLTLQKSQILVNPLIELVFFGERHRFLIDTGATYSVISYELFNKFPLTEQHYKDINLTEMCGSAGKRSTLTVPFKIRLLGKITDKVTVGYFIDEWKKTHTRRDSLFSGLLGQDIMCQFKQVTIDYEVGTISFVE